MRSCQPSRMQSALSLMYGSCIVCDLQVQLHKELIRLNQEWKGRNSDKIRDQQRLDQLQSKLNVCDVKKDECKQLFEKEHTKMKNKETLEKKVFFRFFSILCFQKQLLDYRLIWETYFDCDRQRGSLKQKQKEKLEDINVFGNSMQRSAQMLSTEDNRLKQELESCKQDVLGLQKEYKKKIARNRIELKNLFVRFESTTRSAITSKSHQNNVIVKYILECKETKKQIKDLELSIEQYLNKKKELSKSVLYLSF